MWNEFWNTVPGGFPGSGNEGQRIEELLRKSYREAVPRVREILDDLIGGGGKRLRPALVVLGGQMSPRYQRDETCRLAAAVELLHMATLLHDDWLDGAVSRRGKPTFHQRASAKTAVLAGDFLMTKAFSLSSIHEEKRGLELLSQAAGRLCLSELDQDLSGKGWNVSLKDYKRRIAGKTASLLAASLWAGAWVNRAEVLTAERLRRVGFKMGMAFQIIDDILDYSANPGDTGKAAGRDWSAGIPTLPLIAARLAGGWRPRDGGGRPSAGHPGGRDAGERLEALIRTRGGEPEAFPEAARLVASLGGVEKARTLAEQYTAEARGQLKKLPSRPARESLSSLLSLLLDRTY